jgi:hypothetical protein
MVYSVEGSTQIQQRRTDPIPSSTEISKSFKTLVREVSQE